MIFKKKMYINLYVKTRTFELVYKQRKKKVQAIGLLSTRDRAARKKNAAQIRETLLPENIYTILLTLKEAMQTLYSKDRLSFKIGIEHYKKVYCTVHSVHLQCTVSRFVNFSWG